MMPADPRSDPAFDTPSKLASTSSWFGSRIGTDDPPGITALSARPSRTPPAKSKISSRSVDFIEASYTPGFATWPLTQYNFGPPFFSGPSAAYHSAPRSSTSGTFDSVSTLFTAVGAPYRPATAGNGGSPHVVAALAHSSFPTSDP